MPASDSRPSGASETRPQRVDARGSGTRTRSLGPLEKAAVYWLLGVPLLFLLVILVLLLIHQVGLG